MMEPRQCTICGEGYTPSAANQLFCGISCRRVRRFQLFPSKNPHNLPPSTIGAVGELFVAADFLARGYSVFRPVSMNCFCDLVVIKDGVSQTVEVRTARQNRRNGALYYSRIGRGLVDLVALYVPDTKEVVVMTGMEARLIQPEPAADLENN